MQGGSNRDLSETFQSLVEGACRFLFWLGVFLTVVGAGFLFYTCLATSSDPSLTSKALSNIAILDKVLYAGLVALGISSTVMWWGEQVLAPLQLILAAALWTVPLWLPSAGLASPPGDAAVEAMKSLQIGGTLFGVIAVCVFVGDILYAQRTVSGSGQKPIYSNTERASRRRPTSKTSFWASAGSCRFVESSFGKSVRFTTPSAPVGASLWAACAKKTSSAGRWKVG